MAAEYEIDPSTWPARVAAYVTMARARLAPGQPLQLLDLVGAALKESGAAGDPTAARDLLVAETWWLCAEALHRMEADGEVWGSMGSSPTGYLGTLRAHLGWDGDWSFNDPVHSLYIGTARLQEIQAADWHPLSTWPSVDALVSEARRAYALGLYVAAAVTVRVAVEQAVEESLMSLRSGGPWVGKWAAERERILTANLQPQSFTALDKSATFAILASIRVFGNDAAHNGAVSDASLHALLQRQVSQALVSLYGAVTATAP